MSSDEGADDRMPSLCFSDCELCDVDSLPVVNCLGACTLQEWNTVCWESHIGLYITALVSNSYQSKNRIELSSSLFELRLNGVLVLRD